MVEPKDDLVRLLTGVVANDAISQTRLAAARRDGVFDLAGIGPTMAPQGLSPTRVVGAANGARALLGRMNSTLNDINAERHQRAGGTALGRAPSGGGIARALRWDARIVLMDEPTAALGVREWAQARELIGALKREGRTVIPVLHDMCDVVAVANRVMILAAGRKALDRLVAGRDPAALAIGANAAA